MSDPVLEAAKKIGAIAGAAAGGASSTFLDAITALCNLATSPLGLAAAERLLPSKTQIDAEQAAIDAGFAQQHHLPEE